MKNMYHSCYICDVKVDAIKQLVVLTDSSQMRYYIDISNIELFTEFENWFGSIFSKGVGQTLTVFQYITKDISECETETYIVKFLNLPSTQKTFV